MDMKRGDTRLPYTYTSIYASSPQTTGTALKPARRLILQPGGSDDEIKITLEPVDIGSQSPPHYEALSYVWGEQMSSVPVTINGKYSINITQSLKTALWHLRRVDVARTLWIDAICINQQDLDERARQVAQMGDIYRNAARVVVWLGEASANSKLALEYMTRSCRYYSVDWKTNTLTPNPGLETLFQDTRPLQPVREDGQDLGVALADLFFRPWFERVWIRQEIFLANQDTTIVQCGVDEITWRTLKDHMRFASTREFYYYQDDMIQQAEQNQKVALRVRRILELGREHRANLLSHMQEARWAKCKDPRDRVYGVLNMYDPGVAPGFQIMPDYTLSTADVYKNLTLLYIEQYNSLRIFSYTGGDAHGSGVKEPLPSWVPNWTNENGHGIIISQPWASAGGQLSPWTQLVGERTLRVEGVVVARIAGFGPEPDLRVTLLGGADLSPRNLFKMMYQMFPLHETTINAYGGPMELLEAYCRTVLLGNFKELFISLPSMGDIYYKEALGIMAEMFETRGNLEDAELSDLRQRFFRQLGLVLGKIAITEEGRIALVPKTATAGDELCVLPGCPGVMVLRPTSEIDTTLADHRETYQVVGDAYFDGYMMGEALLGALPKGYKAGFTLWPGDIHSDLAFSDPSGLITRDDPRFGFYKDESSSLVEMKHRRSQITPQTLRDQGILLKQLDLI